MSTQKRKRNMVPQTTPPRPVTPTPRPKLKPKRNGGGRKILRQPRTKDESSLLATLARDSMGEIDKLMADTPYVPGEETQVNNNMQNMPPYWAPDLVMEPDIKPEYTPPHIPIPNIHKGCRCKAYTVSHDTGAKVT